MNGKHKISEKIREFILNQFPLARQRSTKDNDSLLDSGIIDSLGVLEVVTFIEIQYDITLSDEEMLSDNFESISTLTTFIQKKLSCVC